MKPTFMNARNGQRSAAINSITIHSTFDPSREAERFFATAGVEPAAATVIVAGPGLGYLNRTIREHCPLARIIAIHFDTELFSESVALGDENWHPGEPEPVEQFLSRRLNDTDIEGLEFVQWPPSVQAFPALAAEVAQSVEHLVRTMNASIATTGYFGRRWLHNAVANAATLPRLEPLRTDRIVGSCPLVIAAPGPTLEDAIPVVRGVRERVTVWSLASAVLPLLSGGITPDLIVQTDPGFYAAFHTDRASGSGIPTAMPLTAVRGARRTGGSTLLFGQHEWIEHAIFRAAQASVETAPSNLPDIAASGSVAGSALLLGRFASADTIILVGFDEANYDIRSHARPHAFDRWHGAETNRLRPMAAHLFASNGASSQTIAGAAPWRQTRALSTYADYFRSTVATGTYSGTVVRRLLPSPVDIGIPEISRDELLWLLRTSRAGEMDTTRPPDASTANDPRMSGAGTSGSVTDSSMTSSSMASGALAPRRRAVAALLQTWEFSLADVADTDPAAAVSNRLVQWIDLAGTLRARKLARTDKREFERHVRSLIGDATSHLAGLRRRLLAYLPPGSERSGGSR